MNSRFGSGQNQQSILTVLADGTARTCPEIADAIKVPPQIVATTIGRLAKRTWVADSGQRGHYNARKWTITDKGRAVIAHGREPTA